MGPVFERINLEIKNNLSTDVPYISEVCDYTLLSGGKRIRPALFCLAAGLCGYDNDDMYHFSIIFEFIHTASLLHDDVIDKAQTRRGQPAANTVYGNHGVILVGDFLVGKAVNMALETGLIKFIEDITKTAILLSEGEILQLLNIRNIDITEEEYNKVIFRKTASLIQTCCHLGAILAGASPEKIEALSKFGTATGMAFQIMDDSLDYSASEAVFGKPVGQDLEEGKITLPLIYALKDSNGKEKEELTRLIMNKSHTPDEFSWIKEIILKYDCLTRSQKKASALINEAIKGLDIFPHSQARTDLLDMAEFIVTRNK